MNNLSLTNQTNEKELVQIWRETGQTVIACLFLVAIIVIALVGNIGVILVVTIYRKMRQDISNMLLINLSVTDCLNTCSVMLSSLISLIADEWVFGRVWCDIICAVNYCLIIVSMLTLCCISLERYQAIIHPLSYRSKVKRVTLFLAICYTWVQGIVFALVPPVLGWVDFDYWEAICAIQWHLYRPGTVIYVITAFALCFLGPGIILCYCYVKIIKEVNKQKDHVIIGVEVEKHKQRKLSDKSRIVWSLLVVVFAYFICTTPFSLTKLIKVSASDTSIIPGEVNLSASLLGYLASAINPLIYGIFRKDFRRAYFQLLKKIFLNQSLVRRDDFITDAVPTNSGGFTPKSGRQGNKCTDTTNSIEAKDTPTIPKRNGSLHQNPKNPQNDDTTSNNTAQTVNSESEIESISANTGAGGAGVPPAHAFALPDANTAETVYEPSENASNSAKTGSGIPSAPAFALPDATYNTNTAQTVNEPSENASNSAKTGTDVQPVRKLPDTTYDTTDDIGIESDEKGANIPNQNGHILSQDTHSDNYKTTSNQDEMKQNITNYPDETTQSITNNNNKQITHLSSPTKIQGCNGKHTEVINEMNNEMCNALKTDTLIANFVHVLKKNGPSIWGTGPDNQLSSSIRKSTSLTDFRKKDEISAESITTIII